MTPEQLEGYMNRLNLSYRHEDEAGPNGTLFSHFATRWYRSMMPPFGKRMQLLITLSDEGSLLTVMAPFVYHLDQAKRPAVFYEYLIELNYRIKVAHFQVDRRDGEVACVASVPVDNSNLSIDAFQKLLYSVPLVVDCHHKQTKAVLKTGKLPPVPKIPRLDPGFADLLMRVGGSLAKLREIVDAHERQAGPGEPAAKPEPASEPGSADARAETKPKPPSIPLNPLPPPPPGPTPK
jgi:hypothetical protein